MNVEQGTEAATGLGWDNTFLRSLCRYKVLIEEKPGLKFYMVYYNVKYFFGGTMSAKRAFEQTYMFR